MSIWKEDYKLMLELKDYVTSYVTFVQNGGSICDYSETLLNKCISLCIKIKYNRDYVAELCGKDIPSEEQEIENALLLLKGEYVDDRFYDIYDKLNIFECDLH